MEKTSLSTIEEQRQWMRDCSYSQIAEYPIHKDFLSHLRVVFAHHGLTVRKVGIEFLKSREWSDSTRREEYLREIEKFLELNIR